MSTSTTIDKAFEALYAGDDGSLDTAASLLAADPGADAELARRGEAFVRTLWERGWQPADAVRIVRRDLADEHLRVLATLVRAETARYERL
ncbi:aromatic acid decarboxylase, partial [Streptomyces sp. SR27]|nr:aromatic acid decarboxylase [Streptomyces sp. SR27]